MRTVPSENSYIFSRAVLCIFRFLHMFHFPPLQAPIYPFGEGLMESKIDAPTSKTRGSAIEIEAANQFLALREARLEVDYGHGSKST